KQAYSTSYSILVLQVGASKKDLQPVLDLSNRIFDTAPLPPSPHSSLDEWHGRLSLRFIAPSSESTHDPKLAGRSSAIEGSKHHSSLSTDRDTDIQDPIGFVFASPKTYPSLPHPTLHVWLAGIAERARGTGVFAALMAEVETHARNTNGGVGVDVKAGQGHVQALSICTFPARFSRMFSILQREGWQVKEWMDDGQKVLLVKELSN
ncbi:hypothetical protein A1O1_06077, partial [Capronia coronata CBS 617.96]